MALHSLNPATGELIATHEEQSPAAAAAVIDRAQRAFLSWRRTDFAARGDVLRAAAARLRRDRQELARLMSVEMGKPIRQARAEIDKCALVCDHYAENGGAMLAPEPIAADAAGSYVRFDPLGVVLAVMPWNFPFWQVFRFAAPALMAGNACLLKHAANVQGCAAAIAAVLHESGLPPDTFAVLRVGSPQVQALVAHPCVSAVSLTGSDAAGRAVAAAAGRALKKTVLELGGSDPFVVLADAPLAACVDTAVQARMINNGQSCIAAKRFVVVAGVYERFRDGFVAAVSRLKVGDPLDEANDLGPLARADLVDDLERQVSESLRLGARALTGGRRLPGPGFYYPPTVLEAVAPGMPAYDEELFGPAAALIAAADEEEALRIANDTRFGLGAAVWTADRRKGEALAARIDAGSVFVNGMVTSDPRLPFGGVKMSGYGRELSAYGIKEFVNIKTVVVG